MPGPDRRMWICANCGETNVVMPGSCSVCGHPRPAAPEHRIAPTRDEGFRDAEPTRWDEDAAPTRWDEPGARSAPPLPAPWEPTRIGWQPISPREPMPSQEVMSPEVMSEAATPPRARPRAPRNQPPAMPDRPRPHPRVAHVEPPDPEVTWIPEAADPFEPDPPRRSRLVPALPVAVLVAALAAAALLAGPRLLGSATDATTAGTATRAPATATQPTDKAPTDKAPIEKAPLEKAPIEKAPARLVTVDPAVTDRRAAGVAAMFETYFAGINGKDYETIAGIFDPSGELDPADPRQMAAFSDGTATARDSDVVLRRLIGLGDGRLRADVTFRSEQDAGDGPEGRRDETCTQWRVLYTLSGKAGGYRIVRGDGTSRPC